MKVSLLLIVSFLNICVNVYSKIELDVNNKLQNVVIFIKDDVPEGDGSLSDNIQKYVKAASLSLLKATRVMDLNKDGVQFGKVYIVLPTSWKAKTSEYITWQQCNKADIIVSTDRENSYILDPFTMQLGGCGQPGIYTRIPRSFFASSQNSKIPVQGKRIMKEFVKYRYGVFSEDPVDKEYTVYNGSQFVQSICGRDIKWTLSDPAGECSIPNNSCTYNINKTQQHNYSIMFDHESPSSVYFCDDNLRPHNKLGHTLQNVKCNKRSISNVILSHPDFQKNRKKSSYAPPTFVLLKNENRKIVLVLDVSYSMTTILKNMQLAAAEFINNVVEDSAQLGLAVFSDVGSIRSQLLPMNLKSNRDTLVHIINNLVAGGNTNIPGGLKKGVQILGGYVDDSQKLFGTIFLLTDGENNEEKIIWDDMSLINKIIAKGLIVNTIVYGTVVDNKLDGLAKGSGGRFVYANSLSTYTDLMSKFSYRLFCENQQNSSIKIMEVKKDILIPNDEIDVDLFDADVYMGKDLYIRLITGSDSSKFIITLIDPDRKEFGPISITKQAAGDTYTFKFAGYFKVGRYKLRISRRSNRIFKRSTTTLPITYMVSATIKENSSRIINPTGHLSQNEIEEVNSLTKVLTIMDLSTCGIQKDERVQVSLTIENPNKITSTRVLRDDGIGCDSIGGDKIFTDCIYPKDLPLLQFYTFTGTVEIYRRNTRTPMQRTVDLGTLRVKTISQTITDMIPPARINYVNLKIVNEKKRILKIDFLATGDDGLIGNISLYQVTIESMKQTMITVNYETAPLQPVSLTLDLFNVTTNDAFTVAARGIDKAGNAGEWSPTKIFSWHYDEDLRKSSKFAHRNYLQSWFLGVCAVIGLLLLQ